MRNREFHAEVSKLLGIMLVFAKSIHSLISRRLAPAHKIEGLALIPGLNPIYMFSVRITG